MTIKRKIINLIKKIFRIGSMRDFLKRKRIMIYRQIYKEKYNAEDLIHVMEQMGLQKGSIVCLHTSMREMYNYVGTVEEILDGILHKIGEDGTLMMSVIPKDLSHDDVVDFSKRPCRTGIIAETFRNYENVKISYNLYHSVCAWGKYADYLTNSHHESYTCWDQKSPYYKLAQLHGLVFNLGMGKNYIGTISHVAESLLREENRYFSQFFNTEINYSYYDKEGNVREHRLLIGDGFERIPSKNYYVVKKYFDKEKYKIRKLSNLWITCYDASYVVERLMELGRKGIVVYSQPKPKAEMFEKQ